MAKRPITQRCTVTARDGQRCGRRCAPGEVVCAKHDPNRPPAGIIAQQDTDDLRELLRRLTKDRDPAIRLRAIEALLKREERDASGCPRCAQAAEREAANEEMVARATPEQVEELRARCKAVKDLQAVIMTQPVYTEQEPDNGKRTDILEHHQSPGTAAEVPEPSAVSASAELPDEGVERVTVINGVTFDYDPELDG